MTCSTGENNSVSASAVSHSELPDFEVLKAEEPHSAEFLKNLEQRIYSCPSEEEWPGPCRTTVGRLGTARSRPRHSTHCPGLGEGHQNSGSTFGTALCCCPGTPETLGGAGTPSTEYKGYRCLTGQLKHKTVRQ